MIDILFITITFLFFTLCMGLVHFFDFLKRSVRDQAIASTSEKLG